jgi:radical SAM superfamily enzyme YgiQ (UPF0313 family)
MNNLINVNIVDGNAERDELVYEAITNQFHGKFIKRILLVRPPDVDVNQFNYEAGKRRRHSNYPPYGLLVIASNLSAAEYQVECCDLHLEILKECYESNDETNFDFDLIWRRKIIEQIESFKPDLVAVTCMFTMTHKSFISVVNSVNLLNIPVVVGGVHISNDTDFILDELPKVKFAFLQEADLSFNIFVDVVNKKLKISELAQVVVVTTQNGMEQRIKIGKSARPNEQQLDVIPKFDLVDISSYSRYGIMGSAHFMKSSSANFATVLANRGCRAKCTFCSVRGFNGDSVRSRSVNSVVDEIELLRDKFGVEHIMWLDDDLLYNHSRAIKLFNEMARRNLGVTWDAGNGVVASSCTQDVISAAVGSGCISLTIGMESGNKEILRQIKKPASPDTLLRAADVLHQFPSIFVRVFLMLGFPGENISAIRDTINLSAQMNLDWHTITKLQGLPSTEIYKDLTALGRVKKGADTRYSLNTYGHNRRENPLLNIEAFSPNELLDLMDQKSIPDAQELDSLWFIMNYMVNFRRIFNEESVFKQNQILTFIKHISETVAPEHAFALYFQSYLEDSLGLGKTKNIAERLVTQLDLNPAWAYWFKTFGLSVDHIKNNEYPTFAH